MAATVTFNEFNGSSGTETASVSNMNLGSKDSPNLTTTSAPIILGTNSYVKYQVAVVAFITANQSIAYDPYYQLSTNAPGTGITIAGQIINNWTSSPAYVAPTTATTGTAISTAQTYCAFTENTTNTGGSINSGSWLQAASTVTNGALGEEYAFASPVQLQMQTTNAAALGSTTSFTLTFGWQEEG